jgi:hypothetical protein
MRILVALGIVAALLVVPSTSFADGPVITPTITAGTPGDNGWYRSAVTVKIDVTSATDTTCPAVKTFSATTSPAWTCTATSGSLSQTLTLNFKIDADPPTITQGTPDRSADRNGWFNHPTTVTFAATDANSGVASCSSATYSGPDASAASVTGTCRDNAGNVSAPGTYALKYDATPPAVSASAARPADASGWFNHAVGVSFAGTDSGSGIDSCTGSVTYAGPDSGTASIPGSCVDQAGNRGSATYSLRYDATPPTASGKLARAPDDAGWYTHPVSVTFTGSDALSGSVHCTAAKTYSGPDNGAAHVDGTCSDSAGNTAAVAMPLRYDATPPRLGDVAIERGDGTATISWKQPADTQVVVVARAPGRGGKRTTAVYEGRSGRFRDAGLQPGVAYRYTLRSRDAAGNTAVAKVIVKLAALYAPAAGAVARPGDRLAWVAEPGATYYNVQLFFRGHKVMSVWPVGRSLRLPRAWTFNGGAHHLVRGKYRWYVWPGRGPRAKAVYGPLLGGSVFRVR